MKDIPEHLQQVLANIEASLPKRAFQSTLFNLAHAYARISDRSWQTMESERNSDIAGPAIMCQSFAIELLLKFFLAVDHAEAASADDLKKNGIKLNCHKYSELYDQLAVPTQEYIASSYARLSGRATDAAQFRSSLIAQGDDPFVYWRYIYEKPISHIDIAAFNLITDALGKAAEAFQQSQAKSQDCAT